MFVVNILRHGKTWQEVSGIWELYSALTRTYVVTCWYGTDTEQRNIRPRPSLLSLVALPELTWCVGCHDCSCVREDCGTVGSPGNPSTLSNMGKDRLYWWKLRTLPCSTICPVTHNKLCILSAESPALCTLCLCWCHNGAYVQPQKEIKIWRSETTRVLSHRARIFFQ